MAKSKEVSKSSIIRKLYDEGKTVKEIKAKVKCSHALIAVVLRNYKKKKLKAKGKAQFKSPRSRLIQEIFQTKKALDVVEDKPKITRKDLLEQIMPGLDACFGLDVKPPIPPATDLVNHPPHYTKGGVETIDFIEAKDLNYRLGNVIKYVSRAGKKDSDPVQDLEKAAWYLQREITARKQA